MKFLPLKYQKTTILKNLIQSMNLLVSSQKIFNTQIQKVATKDELKDCEQIYQAIYQQKYYSMIESLNGEKARINEKLTDVQETMEMGSSRIKTDTNLSLSKISETTKSGKSDIGKAKDNSLSDIQSLKDKVLTVITKRILILLTPNIIVALMILADIILRAISLAQQVK